MSHATVNRAANDMELRQRVDASVWKEVFGSKTDTVFAGQVRRGLFDFTPFYWRVAGDSEAAYEAALVAGRGSPGHDPDVITDGAITAAVNAAWPEDDPLAP